LPRPHQHQPSHPDVAPVRQRLGLPQGLGGDHRPHLCHVRAVEGLRRHRLAVFAVGVAISLRFLYYYLTGTGLGHVQSLLLSAVLIIVGFQVALIGLVADVISNNRKLIEDLLYRVRRIELATTDPAEAVTSASDQTEVAAIPSKGAPWHVPSRRR